MRLTQRREEFLKKIIDIFKSTELPVHYGTIAKELGVSKWTAYDILKRLEREGYLRSEYVLNSESKNVGRSMIVFYPTEKALIREREEQGNSISQTEDLSKVRERFMEFFERMKHREPNKNIKDLLAELSKTDVPVIFGAYTIAFNSSKVTVSRFNFLLKFCGVWPIRLASSATLIFICAHSCLIISAVVIQHLRVYAKNIINHLVDKYNSFYNILTFEQAK
jgi:DNA-binding Lrp family transcriptional regulator